jgi:hypothetical protein
MCSHAALQRGFRYNYNDDPTGGRRLSISSVPVRMTRSELTHPAHTHCLVNHFAYSFDSVGLGRTSFCSFDHVRFSDEGFNVLLAAYFTLHLTKVAKLSFCDFRSTASIHAGHDAAPLRPCAPLGSSVKALKTFPIPTIELIVQSLLGCSTPRTTRLSKKSSA